MVLKIAKDRKMRTTDLNGHLIVESTIITKAGVNEYLGKEIVDYENLGLDPNRIYRLLRCPEELRKSLDSFKSLQLTIKHIEVGSDKPEKEYTVGSLGSEIGFDGTDVSTSLRIYDGEAIRLIESGKLEELSAGYFYYPDMTQGEYNGEQYDGIMRDIHGNHVALVHRGRIGRDAIIKDSLPEQLGIKIMLKKGAYAKIAKQVKASLALDEDIPTEKLEEIVEAVLDEVPEVAEDEEEEKGDKAKDEEDVEETAEDEEEERGRPAKSAMDAALVQSQITKAVAESEKNLRLGYEAVMAVRPLVGELALDSAENVFKKALSQLGVDYKGNDVEAMKAMIKMKSESKPAMAQDSAPQTELPSSLAKFL